VGRANFQGGLCSAQKGKKEKHNERKQTEGVGVRQTDPISQSCPIRVACKINHGLNPPPTHTHSPCSPYIQHYRMPFPTWKVFVYFSLRFVDFAFFSRGSLSCPKERSKSVQIVTKLRAKYVWNASAQWHDRRRVILTLQAVIVQHQSQYREKRCWLWRSNDGVVQTAAVKKTVNLY